MIAEGLIKLEDTLFGLNTERDFLNANRGTGIIVGWSNRINSVEAQIREISAKIPFMQARLKELQS